MAEMQEELAKHLPGDKIDVKLLRNKKEKNINVELKNVQGNTNVVKNVDLDILGAEFKELSDKEKKQYNIGYGLKVVDIHDGLFQQFGLKKGIVITKVNSMPVKTVDDLQKIVKQANSSSEQVLFISAVTPSGRRVYYSVDLSQK